MGKIKSCEKKQRPRRYSVMRRPNRRKLTNIRKDGVARWAGVMGKGVLFSAEDAMRVGRKGTD